MRRWTIATWLVGSAAGETEAVVRALESVGADAIALQSLGERDLEQIAAALGFTHAWELSHYPRSRLFPGSGVGLAVITPHRVTGSHASVSNEHRSTWSPKRRIEHVAVVERPDHSAYAIAHSVGPTVEVASPSGPVPTVIIRPEQVGVDPGRAVELPEHATPVGDEVVRPVAGAAELQVVTFEMPWVQGDFPVG